MREWDTRDEGSRVDYIVANETAMKQTMFDVDSDIEEGDALAVAFLFAFIQEIEETSGTVKRIDDDEPFAKVTLL